MRMVDGAREASRSNAVGLRVVSTARGGPFPLIYPSLPSPFLTIPSAARRPFPTTSSLPFLSPFSMICMYPPKLYPSLSPLNFEPCPPALQHTCMAYITHDLTAEPYHNSLVLEALHDRGSVVVFVVVLILEPLEANGGAALGG